MRCRPSRSSASNAVPRQPQSTVRSFGIGRERDAVVDAVDVRAAVDRQQMPALSVGVVHRGVERGDPPQPPVVADHHRHDVHRRCRRRSRAGRRLRRTARPAARSAGRCPSRSPPRPGRRRPRAGRGSRRGSRRAAARRRSACRRPPRSATVRAAGRPSSPGRASRGSSTQATARLAACRRRAGRPGRPRCRSRQAGTRIVGLVDVMAVAPRADMPLLVEWLAAQRARGSP